MSDPRFRAEYRISRLIRYNGKRQRFFDGLHRLVLFTNAILGSSAFVSVISGRPALTAWLTAIVAIVSAMDNVVGFSEQARKFQEQRLKYFDLYCELIATDSDIFTEDYFKEKWLRIDRDSPPTRRVLDVVSRNEEGIARGFEFKDTRYIGKIRYIMRHIYDLPPNEWLTVEQRRSEGNFFRRLFRRNSTGL
jgi:hypothetical protein